MCITIHAGNAVIKSTGTCIQRPSKPFKSFLILLTQGSEKNKISLMEYVILSCVNMLIMHIISIIKVLHVRAAKH